MKIVHVDQKSIKGISVRTTNANEMNPSTSKIGNLHQGFSKKVGVNYEKGAHLYVIYFDYESDAAGEYSVLVGSDEIDEKSSEHIERVNVLSGNYMIFEGVGEMPQIVINTWSKVWEFFSKEDVPVQRTFTTDFEFYESQNEIAIYVAVK